MATKKKVVKKKAVKKKVVKKKKATRKKPSAKFYTFLQNNSYGRFTYDGDRGISVNVIVEADSTEDANRRARNIGLYFDSTDDCPCCGSRWSEQYEYNGKDEGTPVPMVYATEVKPGEKYPKQKDSWPYKWMGSDEFEGFIHYKTGKMAGFWK